MSMEYVNTYYRTKFKRGMVVEYRNQYMRADQAELIRVTSATSVIRGVSYYDGGPRRNFHPLDLKPIIPCYCTTDLPVHSNICDTCHGNEYHALTWEEYADCN
jgi:hypothetical protein